MNLSNYRSMDAEMYEIRSKQIQREMLETAEELRRRIQQAEKNYKNRDLDTVPEPRKRNIILNFN